MKFTAHDRVSAEIASFCAAWLPNSVVASCIAHGARNPAMAYKLRQLGVEPGIPDWWLLYDGCSYLPEIKTGKGSRSKAQREMRDRILFAGGKTAIVHSLDDFKAALKEWKIPLLHHPRGDPGLPDDEVGL